MHLDDLMRPTASVPAWASRLAQARHQLQRALDSAGALEVWVAGDWARGAPLQRGDALPVLDLLISLPLTATRSALRLAEGQRRLAASFPHGIPCYPPHAMPGWQVLVDALPVRLIPTSPMPLMPGWCRLLPGAITSPSRQVSFFASIAAQDPTWRAQVTALKRWRDHHALPLPSYAIEVLTAHLVRLCGPAESLREGLIRALSLLGRHTLPVIHFPEAHGRVDLFAPGPAYIADPTWSSNNLLQSLSTADWARTQRAAESVLAGL